MASPYHIRINKVMMEITPPDGEVTLTLSFPTGDELSFNCKPIPGAPAGRNHLLHINRGRRPKGPTGSWPTWVHPATGASFQSEIQTYGADSVEFIDPGGSGT